MADFGKRGGGGRRRSERVSAPLPALVTTMTESCTAIVVNVSRTGVRLRGEDLPGERAELFIKIEHLRLFGTIAWSTDDQCGVVFESPISSLDVKRLQREASSARFTTLSPEERLAAQDWLIGVAR